MDDAVQTVMTQCELWTDHVDMDTQIVKEKEVKYDYQELELLMVAEPSVPYATK